jgi:dihydroorotate dehydrogenase electron transfer subunit
MTGRSPISLLKADPILQDRNDEAEAGWSPSIVGEAAEVLANDSVNLEYRHLVVRCSAVSASAVPGQFFQLLCPHTEGAQPFLRRPMSLYGVDPARREVEFLYKIAGAGTRGLATLRAGDTIDIMGPLGSRLHA